jgi:hypothetical protein
MVVPVKAELIVATDDLARRLTAGTLRGLEQRRRDLRALTRTLPQADALLTNPRQRLDQASLRLGQALAHGTLAQRGRLDRVAARLTPRIVETAMAAHASALKVQGEALDRARKQGLSAATTGCRPWLRVSRRARWIGWLARAARPLPASMRHGCVPLGSSLRRAGKGSPSAPSCSMRSTTPMCWIAALRSSAMAPARPCGRWPSLMRPAQCRSNWPMAGAMR